MKTSSFRHFALVLSILLVGFGEPFSLAAAPEGKQPNLVVIFIDDMGYADIGPFGNTVNQTPNLDRMVGEGFSFHSAYCGGSFSGAVCVASRSMTSPRRPELCPADTTAR